MNAEQQLHDIYKILGKDFVLALVENTKKAMQKHPVFSEYDEERVFILEEEFQETKQAFYTETTERTKEELLDVATVCSRWYNC